MSRESAISFTIGLVQVLRALCFIALALLAVDLILRNIQPDLSFIRWQWYMEQAIMLPFPEQSNGSYYLNWIKVGIQVGLLLLIWQEVLAILRSQKAFETFIRDNARRLFKIRNILIILWLMDIFNLFQAAGEVWKVTWSFELDQLFLIMAVHILALVFQEGKKIADDQNLIV